jgi:DNA replication and repair protein RecF
MQYITCPFVKDFFLIDGVIEKEGREDEIRCNLKRGGKKTIKRNEKNYDKLSDHIGRYPLVIISPYDRDLITEGSDTRRKFLDSVIGQSNKTYLQNLIRYNKALMQRNALLKYFSVNHTFNQNSLEIYDQELIKYGEVIHEERKRFLKQFTPSFLYYYNWLSEGKEEVTISYESQLFENTIKSLLDNSLEIDKRYTYTTKGIHKDDLLFQIAGHPIKKMGSQGQQKSFLIALKIAQLEFIKKEQKITPIFLLDDIFDKLDEIRVEQLIRLVNEEHFGQIFITDTHPERTESVLKRINEDHKTFMLS